MNQSYFNHLAHPQLKGQLGKCLDQGLLCTDPVSVGRGAFTDSLPDSHFHSFVYLFSHLLIHSFIYVPTSCSLGYLNAYSSFIHCALHSFTHSFPQHPCNCSLLSLSLTSQIFIECLPSTCTVSGSGHRKGHR